MYTKPILQKKSEDRRCTPRYPSRFLIRSILMTRESSTSPLYDGLGIVRNISTLGMCLEVKIDSAEQYVAYTHTKKITLIIDLFFSGNTINCKGEIAWVSCNSRKNRLKMGLNFKTSAAHKIDDIIQMFNEEKNAQEQFFLNLL